jgi:hypothetical protein
MSSTRLASLLGKLERVGEIQEPEVLLDIWRSARQEIVWLIEHHLAYEADTLARSYTTSFMRYNHKDIEVTRQVVEAFPANDASTMDLLGIDDEIDQFIIENKLRIEYLTQSNNHGTGKVLAWAAQPRNQRLDIIKAVTHQIGQDLAKNDPGASKTWGAACYGMIWNLTRADQSFDMSGEIDRSIARTVATAPEYRMDATQMVDMARFGLKETFLALARHGMFFRYDPSSFSDLENRVVMDMLPSNPALHDLQWMHDAFELPGLSEKILLDPQVDIEAYVEILRTTDYGRHRLKTNLTYETFSRFISLYTPEQLNTTEKKHRASKLLNAVTNQMTAADTSQARIRANLKMVGFSDYMLKMCRLTSGSILEDELGL